MSAGSGDGAMPGRTTRSELAADHALGLAEGAELERALRLMESDASFRAEVEGLRRTLAGLDASAPERQPDPGSWNAIETAIDGAASPPVAVPTRRWFDSIAFWRPAAFAAGAAALLMAIGLAAALLRPPMQPIFVAVLQTEEGRAQAVVNAYADGTVTLVPITQIGVRRDGSSRSGRCKAASRARSRSAAWTGRAP